MHEADSYIDNPDDELLVSIGSNPNEHSKNIIHKDGTGYEVYTDEYTAYVNDGTGRTFKVVVVRADSFEGQYTPSYTDEHWYAYGRDKKGLEYDISDGEGGTVEARKALEDFVKDEKRI